MRRRDERPAWKSRHAWITVAATAAAGLVADLATKYAAFDRLAGTPVRIDRNAVLPLLKSADPRAINSLVPAHEPTVVVGGLLEFTLVLNPGAVFGVGPGQRGFFVLFTLIALTTGLAVFAFWTRAWHRVSHAAIGLLLAGGLGNLYDRLVYACVRDFIHPLPRVRWPGGMRVMGSREAWPYVSNVADLLLIVGIATLMWVLWRKGPVPAAGGSGAAAAAEPRRG